MTNLEFVDKLKNVLNFKTLYVMGSFGTPLDSSNKIRMIQHHTYNQSNTRKQMILNASSDTFGFDCVNLGKAIAWGWNGNLSDRNGGAKYASNGCPDTNADGMIKICKNVSTDFTSIEIGEAVWMQGHIGFYIGEGLVIECSPKWKNGVQITGLANKNKFNVSPNYNKRTWIKHGKLPFLTYINSIEKTVDNNKNSNTEIIYEVVRGDTLTAISKKFNTTVSKLATLNNISNPNKIYVGQIIKIK